MSRKIKLTKGYHATVDKDDFKRINALSWYASDTQWVTNLFKCKKCGQFFKPETTAVVCPYCGSYE